MFKYCLLLLFLLIFISIAFAEEDSLSFATYYPAPYGNYREMRAMRMAIGDNYIKTSEYDWETGAMNLLNSNTDLIVEGNVGIGTANPQVKLDVAGGFRIGNNTQVTTCDSATEGTMRYNTAKRMEFCDGSGWQPMGNTAPTSTCIGGSYGYNPSGFPCPYPHPITRDCSCPSGCTANPQGEPFCDPTYTEGGCKIIQYYSCQ